MPENYIALFRAPDEKTSKQIIGKAEGKIKEAANIIKSGVLFPKPKVSAMAKMSSGLVNSCFYRFVIADKKFLATDACITCGHCEKVCPLNNITIVDGRPRWNGNCTHCMACICTCPKEAIEYGKASRGRIRYYCKSE